MASIAAAADVAALVYASTDPWDKTLVIRRVTPNMVTFSAPFNRGPLPLGGRSTAIILASGEIFVYASTRLTQATRAALDSMGGRVGWIVAPSGAHSLFLESWHRGYPEARVIGVQRLKDKLRITWAGLILPTEPVGTFGFEPEITLFQVYSHANHELVAVHGPTSTLLEGDVLFNLPGMEQYSRAPRSKLSRVIPLRSFSPGGRMHNTLVSSFYKDPTLLRSELSLVRAAKWDRIIPCHGDVIETGGKEAFDKVYAKFM